jgi:hypothetical protein
VGIKRDSKGTIETSEVPETDPVLSSETAMGLGANANDGIGEGDQTRDRW